MHKLGIIHRHGVEFVSFQLLGKAKKWWRSLHGVQIFYCWTHFHSLFLEQYVSRTLKDHKKDEFMGLEQGGMFVSSYEAKFYVFSRYATQLVTTKDERIQIFIRD